MNTQFAKYTVAIVDDCIDTRRIMRFLLRTIGFSSIEEAEDGRAAMKLIKKKRIHIIVSDWEMPNMDGIQLLTELRSTSRYSKIPFLMLTRNGSREEVMTALKAGTADFVVKPTSAEVLEEKLAKMIANLK